MNNIIPAAPEYFQSKGAYTTWSNSEEFNTASASMNKALQTIEPIYRSKAAIANRWQNIDTNVSVRDSFTKFDYEFFRPGEQFPKFFRDIIAACMGAYQKVPVIKQTIDLMGDFTAQGIRLLHADEDENRFYNAWFKHVKGPERTERMANCLYRTSNVIVKRANAELDEEIVKEWKKSVGKSDLDYRDIVSNKPNEIPYRYTLINPLLVEVLNEQIAAFTGKNHYVLQLPLNFYNQMSAPYISFNPSILTQDLPRDLQSALENNQQYILLDPDKLVTMYYKKDDWDVWAYPILYGLLDDVIYLQKMKMADMTALDGVISHIRVWKLGSMEHKIFPTDAAIAKLSSILLNNSPGGSIDLIWGPDLELDETSTDIAKFLGSEKYEFVMNSIHNGLGIPAAIGRTKGTYTDNFMSLRVLMERLNYGRNVITCFWENEVKIVQKAMGFKEPAKVYYDNMNLSDEVAEKALWIQLVDRDLVPAEAVQERFGRIPEIDNILINREYAARKRKGMVDKVSPYHDAQPELSKEKIALQRGVVTPSQVGLDVPDSELPIPLGKPSTIIPQKKKTGVSGEGRPPGSSDKEPRKKRRVLPNSKAREFFDLSLRANKLQKIIAEVVNPFLLDKSNKKSLAGFSLEEGVAAELIKFHILCNIPINAEVSHESVLKYMSADAKVYSDMETLYKKMAVEFTNRAGQSLSANELRNIRSYVYALMRGNYDDGK